LSNNGILKVKLDLSHAGLPSRFRGKKSNTIGLFVNFCRLTGNALREYDASRHELLNYFSDRAAAGMCG
jgi:hypothetical protein